MIDMLVHGVSKVLYLKTNFNKKAINDNYSPISVFFRRCVSCIIVIVSILIIFR